MATCGAAGLVSSRMLAVKSAKSASLAESRSDSRPARRWRSVAASDRTQTRCTVPPPRSATHDCHRRTSWICWVKGADSRTGQPCERISRAVAVIPVYSWTLMCRSYHGPSRSPGGRAAAVSVAATNGPYIVSLSRSAGGGTRFASKMPATVLLPAPGGPATTQAGAGTVMAAASLLARRRAGVAPGDRAGQDPQRRPQRAFGDDGEDPGLLPLRVDR